MVSQKQDLPEGLRWSEPDAALTRATAERMSV